MTVKHENEVYEYLKQKNLTCLQISNGLDLQYRRVWTALTQLEMRKLVEVKNNHWCRTDDYS